MKHYSRWHRFDNNGVKYIMKCDVDKHPEPLQCEGFTQWTRGTGPHSPEALKNIQEGLRKACLGVPKKESTKQKMRNAKLGKRKSLETRQRMSASHQHRIQQKELSGVS
jgi:hypothetical protein